MRRRRKGKIRTKQNSRRSANARVRTGDDGGASLELSCCLVRLAVRGNVVDGGGVELLLEARRALLGLEGDLEAWLELLWDVARHGGRVERTFVAGDFEDWYFIRARREKLARDVMGLANGLVMRQ